jgi:DNA-binding NtrC family response regulator
MPRATGLMELVPQPATRSLAMRRLDRVLRVVASKDVVITLVGESGSGKEILARRAHELSRRTGPFILVNCAAIPEALFESELFGHEKGAFTGAGERTRGKIEAANGGTLFLDEIGEMPLGAQAKLLRFIENRKFMRVGGTHKIAVDIRLVTATLRPIEEEVKAGRFRADLFYRIEGVTLRVPPLRERGADLDALIDALLASASARHGTKPPRLGRAAVAALRAYDWPGNVRELRNVVDVLCLLRDGRHVGVTDLPDKLQPRAPSGAEPGTRSRSKQLLVQLDRPLEETVDRILQLALELEGGNRSRAARRLSISLRTMQRYAARVGAHART